MKKLFKAALAASVIAAGCLCATACGDKSSYHGVSPLQSENGKVYALQTKARAGEKVRLSCMPELGYKLKGYEVDGVAIDGNTFTMPDKSVEVSAVFEPIIYTITYLDENGEPADSLNNLKTYTVENWGASLTQPDKYSYDVGGWYYYFAENENLYLDNIEYFRAETIAQGTFGNLTLYARRYNIPHVVNLDESLTQGYVYASPDFVVAGEEVHLYYSTYEPDYYRFVCFVVDGEEIEGDSFIMGHKNVLVSAKFVPLDFEINYDLDGGTVAGENPSSFNIESESVTLIAPSKDGYEFVRWVCLNSDGNYIGTEILPDEEIDLSQYLGHGNITFQACYEEIEAD